MASEKQAYEDAHKEFDDAAKPTQVAGLSDSLKSGLSKVGKVFLGAGTERDATADGHAYRMHMQEAVGNGEKPMSREEFLKSQGAKAKA